MGKPEIEHELREIRQVLDLHHETDPHRAQAAARLKQDIDDFLQAKPPFGEEEHDNMLDSIRQSIREFEASHPTLGIMIEKFLDTLSNLGI